MIRYATPEDVRRWYGGQVPATMRAMVLEQGGELHAIAGIAAHYHGQLVFSDVAPEGRANRMGLGRLTVAFVRLLDRVGGPFIAARNLDEPTAPGLLAHMGFVDRGDVWVRS